VTATRYTVSPVFRERLGRLAWRLDTPVGLVAMFGVAFGVRLAIAPWVGFYNDLYDFRWWAGALAHVGPHRFYSSVQFVDYPPGYLYVLWVIGKISATPGYLLLKIPAFLGDLGVAWVAGTLAARIAPASLARRVPLRPLVAAAVLFNPAILFESAVFGQVNAVPAFFVLSTLLLLLTGRPSLKRDAVAFVLFGFAFATKPQACFALPVLLYVLYRRYLHRRPRPELIDGALSVALIGIGALAVWIASALPFGLGPVKLYHFYSKASGTHPYTSSDAYNLWGLLGPWRNDRSGDHVFTLAGVPALYVGLLLFAAAVVFILVATHRALDRGASWSPTLVFAAALTSLLGYALLTRMHEHYVFPAVVLLATLTYQRPIRWAYAALSALLLLSIWFSFVGYNIQAHVQALRVEPLFGWLYGDFSFFTWQTRTYSILVIAIALVLARRGFGYFVTEPRQGESAAEPPPAERELPPRPAVGWMSRLARLPSVGLEPREDAASSTTWAARFLPATLVGLAAIFGLVVLRGETQAAQNLNDSSFHLQMVRWASGQIDHGRVPLDGWFPYFSMGSSFFHHYQSLAETLTAYVSHVIGAGNQTTYDWFLYLLLALWPIPVYVAARLLEWERWPAACAAAVAPLIVSTPGYGYEHGSYTWQGYGVYSQLWAMWALPLAWGLTWRVVARGRYYAAAALALALTVASHFMTGYVAVLTVGVWVIILGAGYLRRAGRAALVVGGSVLIAAWVLVPLLGDTKWTTQTAYYRGTFINDAYGARKTLGWLFSGELFDLGRFPILTILFFAGLVACVLRSRTDMRARALLGALTLNLLLTFGRRTFGSLIDAFPGFRDAELNRFIIGLDLAGIFIAGVGLAWLVRAAYLGLRWLATGRPTPGRYAVAGAIMLVLAVGVLQPAWAERARYDNRGSVLIRSQQDYEATDGRDLDRLVAIAERRHGGRVYAGMRGSWGEQYRVGSVPVHAWLADRGVDAIGFTFRTIASLSTDVEAAFDETNPSQYQMFNVRYLILPSDRQPPVPARLVASDGRHRLWEVSTTGYFQVVDRSAAISEDRTNIEQQTRGFRQSDLASRGIYPGIAFAGGAAPPPTFSSATPPPGPAGKVLTQTNDLADGVFDATVTATRRAVVLLKASFDPRWSVTVDGGPAKAVMMAPSLVGVEVPAGRHAIRFHYKPYGHYPLLLTIGLLAVIGLVLLPRRSRMARRLAALRGGRFPRPGWAGDRISRTAAAHSGARRRLWLRQPLSGKTRRGRNG
jgi:Gpi18-like mannosyltransferase